MKTIKVTCLIVAAILITAFATYKITMMNLSIETDGDGDSAIVTVYGQSDLYRINGHTVG